MEHRTDFIVLLSLALAFLIASDTAQIIRRQERERTDTAPPYFERILPLPSEIDLYFASYRDMARYGSNYQAIYKVEFPFGVPKDE